jgi:hypothetical protein
MLTKTNDNWFADLQNMTCCNVENQMVIAFEKRGTALMGRIKNIPIELLEKWAADPDGNKYIRKAVIEADEVFFKAYFNREI